MLLPSLFSLVPTSTHLSYPPPFSLSLSLSPSYCTGADTYGGLQQTISTLMAQIELLKDQIGAHRRHDGLQEAYLQVSQGTGPRDTCRKDNQLQRPDPQLGTACPIII